MDAELVKCAAKYCTNRLLERTDLTFFKFPEDENLAKIWAQQSNAYSYNYGSTICSEHFEDKYFDTNYKKSVFKTDTFPVPTIFNKTIEPYITPKIFDYNLQDNLKANPLKVNISHAEYCRLCAKLLISNNFISIFDNSNFAAMLDMCLPGKIKETDELSHLICSTCAHSLTACYKILKSFSDIDSKLRSYLHKDTIDLTESIQTEEDAKEMEAFLDELETTNSVDEFEITDIETIIENKQKLIDPVSINKPRKIPSDFQININKEKVKIELQCIVCATIFKSKEEIMLHAFHKHPSLRGKKIISKIIKSNVQNDDKHQKQKNAQNTNIQYECIICMKIFNVKEDIISHTKEKHKEFLQNKILIKVNNIQNTEISSNVDTEVPIKFMCTSCPTVFSNKMKAMYHSALHHPNSKIVSKIILMNNHLTSSDALLHKKLINQINTKTTLPSDNTKVKSDAENLTINNLFNTNKYVEKYRKYFDSYISKKQKFKIKYQCEECSDLFNNYRDVFEHSKNNHFDGEEIRENIIVVKIKSDQEDIENKENNSLDEIIPVDDDSFEEIDPNLDSDALFFQQSKEIIATRYKCMKCFKLFFGKKVLIRHALSAHPTPGLNEINCKVVKVKIKKDLTIFDPARRYIYECLICATHHKTKIGLLVHTRKLHPFTYKHKFLCRVISWKNKEPLHCLHCTTIPASFFLYRKHMKQHISYACEGCNTQLKNRKDLIKHLNVHKLNQKKQRIEYNKCIVCEEEFSNRKALFDHEKIHKISKEVQCSKCNKRYDSEYDLKKHEKQHVVCLCDICGKTYEVGYLRNHLETHNIDCPFKCKICSKEFKTSNSLFKHRKRHTTPHSKAICQICGKVLQRRSLFLHMKIHSTEKSETCDICGAAFRRKDHLRIHKATHANDVLKTYGCPLCEIVLNNRKCYIRHLSDQHGIKNETRKFFCHLCEKQFNQRIYFEDHLKMHSGVRNFSCNECDGSFITERALKQHSLTHLEYNQLPFKCDICDKKFRRSSQLKNHSRIHTGEKPFPCPICQRPFRICGDMVKHMKIHSKRKRVYKKPKLEINTDEEIFYIIHDTSDDINKDMPTLE